MYITKICIHLESFMIPFVSPALVCLSDIHIISLLAFLAVLLFMADYEVDFPDSISQKVKIIENTAELRNMIHTSNNSNNTSTTNTVTNSTSAPSSTSSSSTSSSSICVNYDDYILLGCDMRDIQNMKRLFENMNIDYT